MSLYNKLFLSLICFFSFAFVTAQYSEFIHVDHFGYAPDAAKVAVISNPEIGFNANQSYEVGNMLQLINVDTNQIVFAGAAIPWNAGTVHDQSGDRGWWFDFSTYNIPGNYKVYDPTNDESSAPFIIDNSVYDDLLQTTLKMFYYNRSYCEKVAPYALPGFTDDISFAQDEFTRNINNPTNTDEYKDMRGGWFDAGDNNKYVTFVEAPVHDLLWAFRLNPETFTDDFNIPETGNGIPDILDEIKWETDWLIKMMRQDGAVHIKMGNRNYSENVQAPPSANQENRFYAPVCTSSTIATAGMLAHTATVFSDFPGLTTYSETVGNAAILAWEWVLPFLENDTLQSDCDNGMVVAGDADRTIEEQKQMALTAAIYLLELTGDPQYNQYIIDHTTDSDVLENAQWNNYNLMHVDALLHYTTLTHAQTQLVNQILTSATIAATNNYNNYFYFNQLDLYRAYSNDWTYHWGSNYAKAQMANLNLIFAHHGINASRTDAYRLRAQEMLHYYHGLNPLSQVYLTNMQEYGGENSLNEIYHFWFSNGTEWDHAEETIYGPAPGYLSGGCNANYSANTNLTPPYNQPLQKSYLDFNNGFPDNAWELTEPAIYYQAAYVRLLSQVINHPTSTLHTESMDNLPQTKIQIYPNPTTDIIHLKAEQSIDIVQIYDISGAIVVELEFSQTHISINISHLPQGVYILMINNNPYKLIKE